MQKHGTTDQEKEANVSAQLTSQIEASYNNKEVDAANAAAQRMKESLEKAEKAFEKANNDVPSGKYLMRDTSMTVVITYMLMLTSVQLGRPA